MWLHLPVSPARILTLYFDQVATLVQMIRVEARRIIGKVPPTICLPYTKQQLDWDLQNCDNWAIALAQYSGVLDNHYPKEKLVQFASSHAFIFPKVVRDTPIASAVLVFIDGSSNGRAVFTIQGQVTVFNTRYTSAQVVELQAVLAVIKHLPTQAFNLYTESHYVVWAMEVIETVPLIETTNPQLQSLFREIQHALRQRTLPWFFGHLRAHTGLPGPLSEGNNQADLATQQIFYSQEQLAQQSHAIHHQNSNSLRQQFKITREAARQIVKQCAHCTETHTVPHYGVNPRRLKPNHLWQIDITHIASFGKLKYVHVTIDTFSGFLMATAQAGEASKHCIAHCLKCFAVMGQPKCMKTDNGPGYIGQKFQKFCHTLGIDHKTGIPYNPQGQGIIERAHSTLKNQLQKIKKGEPYPVSPQNSLHHALFILNFLILDSQGNSAAQRFWGADTKNTYAQVRWKDPLTGSWYGPDSVLI